jgi:hypothetical protein
VRTTFEQVNRAALGALVAVVSIAGCGGEASGSVVVRVGGTPIGKAAVDHWMSVVAAGATTAPGQPTPKPPDPPSYTKCIAYLRAFAPWAQPVDGRPRPTATRLKSQCEYEYRKFKLKALYTLIPDDWVSGEAAELGITVTGAQLRQRLALVKGEFPSENAFKRYLASKGATVADLLLGFRQALLAGKIQQRLEAENDKLHLATPQRQQVLNKFSEEFKRKWTARTDCQAGYVVPICKQYKAPKTPPRLVPPSLPLTNMAPE